MLGTLEVLQFGLLLVVGLLFQNQTGSAMALSSSCLETSKDDSSAASLGNVFSVALPSWGEDFSVSAVGQ